MARWSVPAAVSTYRRALDSVPLHEGVAVPDSSVQPFGVTVAAGVPGRREYLNEKQAA